MDNLIEISTVLFQPYKTKATHKKLLVKKKLAKYTTETQLCVKYSAYNNPAVK